MILAYITSVYGRASDTFIRGEIRELRRMGHTVHTFSIRRPTADQAVDEDVRQAQNTTQYLLDAGVWRLLGCALLTALLTPLRFCRAAVAAFRSGPAGLRSRIWQVAYLIEASLLSRWMRHFGVQHLHDHIGENSATVALLASILSRTPFSMTLHGPSVFYAPERFGLAVKLQRAAFTICISEFCRSQCMVFAPSALWDRLHIVHCGVDESFLAQSAPPPATAPRLLSIGRLCEEKGQLLLIEAAARLAAANVAFELVLIGDGPMRGDIEALIRRYNLAGQVHLLGWQSGDAIRAQIIASRALVLPSFAEGLPVVLMEAMALGRPAISTYVAGIPELVRPNENGWLVPAGSLDELVSAMKEALEAPIERLAGMGRRGASLVRQQHDAGVEALKLVALFGQSVEASSPHPAARPLQPAVDTVPPAP